MKVRVDRAGFSEIGDILLGIVQDGAYVGATYKDILERYDMTIDDNFVFINIDTMEQLNTLSIALDRSIIFKSAEHSYINRHYPIITIYDDYVE